MRWDPRIHELGVGYGRWVLAALSAVLGCGGDGPESEHHIVPSECSRSLAPILTPVAPEPPPPIEQLATFDGTHTGFASDGQSIFIVPEPEWNRPAPHAFEVRALRFGDASWTPILREEHATFHSLQHPLVERGSDLFWLEGSVAENGTRGAEGDALRTVPKFGGQPRTLAQHLNTAFSAFAVGDAAVYLTVGFGPVVLSAIPRSGGNAKALVRAPDRIGAIAVDGSHVYFSDEKSVSRISTDGAGANVIATGLGFGASLVAHGEFVYVVSLGRSQPPVVVRVPKIGGGPCLTLPAPWSTSARRLDVAVDDTGIYAASDEDSRGAPIALHWSSLDGKHVRLLARLPASQFDGQLRLVGLMPRHVLVGILREPKVFEGTWTIGQVAKPLIGP